MKHAIRVVSANLVAMSEATQPVDVLWLHLFYHDLHTALIQAEGATASGVPAKPSPLTDC